MENTQLIIAVDFDGTVVKHKYPAVGDTVEGSVETLQKLVDKGHKIVLWTMRDKSELEDAVKWFEEKNIPLHGTNSNPDQSAWTSSPKAYAQLYIDDAALGCPLKFDREMNWYVDWLRVSEILQHMKVL